METQRYSLQLLSMESRFDGWSWKLKAELRRRGLSRIIMRPPTQADQQHDNEVFALLTNILDDEVSERVESASTSYELYRQLEALFEGKKSGAVDLKREIDTLVLRAGKGKEYIEKLEELNNKLGRIGSRLPDDELLRTLSNAVSRCNELSQLDLALMGLAGEAKKFEVAKRMLLQQDRRFENREEQVNAVRQGGKSVLKCFYCDKPGHFQGQCRKKRQDEAEKEKQARQGTQTPSSRGRASAILESSSQSRDIVVTWIIDSGASDHFACHRELFELLEPCEPFEVEVANGGKTVCHQWGIINIEQFQGKILTLRAFYAPELNGCFYSVQKADDAGLSVQFSKGVCKVYDEETTYMEIPKNNKSYVFRSGIRSRNDVIKVDASPGSACVVTPIRNQEMISNGSIWHSRLGHLNEEKLSILRDKFEYIKGMAPSGCEVCAANKAKRPAFRDRCKATERLELIHSDLCSVEFESIDGCRYFQTVIDDFSSFCQIYFLQDKSEAATNLIKFVNWAERRTGCRVKTLRTDGGGEFKSRDLEQFLVGQGIEHDTTPPYTPESNGMAERRNRVLMDVARCMMNSCKLPKEYSIHAVRYANWIVNRLPSRGIGNEIPYERFTSKRANLKHTKVFGCLAFVVNPKPVSKLTPRADECVFLGLTEDQERTILANMSTGQVFIHRGVRVLEDKFPYIESRAELSTQRYSSTSTDRRLTLNENRGQVALRQVEEVYREQGLPLDDSDFVSDSEPSSESDSGSEQEYNVAIEPPVELRRSQRVNRGVPPDRLVLAISGQPSVVTPSTYSEAISSPERDYWAEAMNSEIESLMRYGVFEIVNRPNDKRVLKVKWHYDLKRDPTGAIERFKARLVVKGFQQIEGVDFGEIHAPVAHFTSLRILLAVAMKQGMKLYQIDVETAYLNSHLKEELYTEFPDGQGEQGKCWKLQKSLYGLRQGAKDWFDTLRGILQGADLEPSSYDQCIYTNADHSVLVAVYVDDVLVAAKHEEDFENFKRYLDTKIRTKQGDCRKFLGIVLERSGNCLRLHQKPYIESLLKQFGLENARPAKSPMDEFDWNHNAPVLTDIPYRSLIGSLAYVSSRTRPDIAAAVHILSRFLNSPTLMHFSKAKTVLAYLKSTIDHCLVIDPGSEEVLTLFTDSDYSTNTKHRKSTSGILIKVFGTSVHWSSNGQNAVSLSTAEAELYALSCGISTARWCQLLLSDIGFKCKVLARCDNQSAIIMFKDRSTGRAKHIDTRACFILDSIAKEQVEIKYISSEDQAADGLTKCTKVAQVDRVRAQLLGNQNLALHERGC